MMFNLRIRQIVFVSIALFCLTPWVGPPLALILGILTTAGVGEIYDKQKVHRMTSWCLKGAVVGLGFGMNFYTAIYVGKEGLFFTIISICTTLGLGYYLGKKLAVDSKTSVLISSGTAICGGSAIAAMSPVINADDKQISVALGTVFVLNSVALFLFPFIGHFIYLSQTQFGYWAAIAIHDTSSVVGAAASYGNKALDIATSVKLERALWILPVTFIASLWFKEGNKQIHIPYFIFLFVIAMLVNTFVPAISFIAAWIVPIAEKSLTLTLFLIGTGLSVTVLKQVGFKPFLKGTLLWIFISATSLWMILQLA